MSEEKDGKCQVVPLFAASSLGTTGGGQRTKRMWSRGGHPQEGLSNLNKSILYHQRNNDGRFRFPIIRRSREMRHPTSKSGHQNRTIFDSSFLSRVFVCLLIGHDYHQHEGWLLTHDLTLCSKATGLIRFDPRRINRPPTPH